jgi:hypothetical protein
LPNSAKFGQILGRPKMGRPAFLAKIEKRGQNLVKNFGHMNSKLTFLAKF